jgi:hypothetical protein
MVPTNMSIKHTNIMRKQGLNYGNQVKFRVQAKHIEHMKCTTEIHSNINPQITNVVRRYDNPFHTRRPDTKRSYILTVHHLYTID